ncbi:MAG: bacteriohemerythrin [Nitrospinota bacterium]|nr:bacteriohemerythrin [Nitrospinota bacterium]
MLRWDESYSVGIEKFDAQHKNFFRILEQLAQDADKGGDAVCQAIDGLLTYVTNHFREEEELMRSLGYPGYEDHVKEHGKMMEKTQELYSDMDAGRPDSVENMQLVLIDWILEHIGKIDQQYVSFFQEKGIS